MGVPWGPVGGPVGEAHARVRQPRRERERTPAGLPITLEGVGRSPLLCCSAGDLLALSQPHRNHTQLSRGRVFATRGLQGAWSSLPTLPRSPPGRRGCEFGGRPGPRQWRSRTITSGSVRMWRGTLMWRRRGGLGRFLWRLRGGAGRGSHREFGGRQQRALHGLVDGVVEDLPGRSHPSIISSKCTTPSIIAYSAHTLHTGFHVGANRIGANTTRQMQMGRWAPVPRCRDPMQLLQAPTCGLLGRGP